MLSRNTRQKIKELEKKFASRHRKTMTMRQYIAFLEKMTTELFEILKREFQKEKESSEKDTKK